MVLPDVNSKFAWNMNRYEKTDNSIKSVKKTITDTQEPINPSEVIIRAHLTLQIDNANDLKVTFEGEGSDSPTSQCSPKPSKRKAYIPRKITDSNCQERDDAMQQELSYDSTNRMPNPTEEDVLSMPELSSFKFVFKTPVELPLEPHQLQILQEMQQQLEQQQQQQQEYLMSLISKAPRKQKQEKEEGRRRRRRRRKRGMRRRGRKRRKWLRLWQLHLRLPSRRCDAVEVVAMAVEVKGVGQGGDCERAVGSHATYVN